MIITNNGNGTYTLNPTAEEREAIEWMRANFVRKFERWLEDYLRGRHLNMRAAIDREVVNKLSDAEKETIRNR